MNRKTHTITRALFQYGKKCEITHTLLAFSQTIKSCAICWHSKTHVRWRTVIYCKTTDCVISSSQKKKSKNMEWLHFNFCCYSFFSFFLIHQSFLLLFSFCGDETKTQLLSAGHFKEKVSLPKNKQYKTKWWWWWRGGGQRT